MGTTVVIPERLIPRISEAAKKEGYDRSEDFLTHIIEQKLLELEERERVFQITEKVREALEARGISEQQTLADFDEFRGQLYRERTRENDRR